MTVEKKNEPQQIETRGLLLGAAGAFGAGLMGAIWHTKRKQEKQMAAELAQGTPAPSIPSTIPEYTPPKMTPAEYAIAKKDARFFAIKTLGYGTLLALGGAGVIAAGVGWYLDVRNFKQFSDKLQEIIPRHTKRLRAYLGGKELVMNPEEVEEWKRAVENDE